MNLYAKVLSLYSGEASSSWPHQTFMTNLSRSPLPVDGDSHRCLFWLPVLLLLLFAGPVMAASGEVTAQIDATSVALGQPLTLTLDARGQLSSGPDLSVLEKDFDVLNRSVHRSVSVINGQRSERSQLVLTLRPRRVGELQIPAISFGGAATQPLQLTVTGGAAGQPAPGAGPAIDTEAPDTNAPAAPAVLLETQVDPKQARIRQQMVLTAKVLMSGPVAAPQLRDPDIPSATILPLGEDRYTTTRDGQDYSVYERRYAIFPQDAGLLKIPPLTFEGWTSGADSTGLSPYGYPRQPVRAESQPMTIQVLPAPAGTQPDAWLPARNVSLTESAPTSYEASAGQPIQRQVTLRVDGIQASDLPPISLGAPYELVQQQDQPRLWNERRPEGVVGVRQETVALSTSTPGRYQLPPVNLKWWNTRNGRWETAVLPARDLVVTAAGTTRWANVPQTPATVQQTWPSFPTQSRSQGTTVVPGEPVTGSKEQQAPAGGGRWRWLTVALGLAWIGTMLAWWRSRQRGPGPAPGPLPERAPIAPEPVEAEPVSPTIAAVRTAYEAENAATAREALLAWAREVLPEDPPSNLARLAQRCPEPLRGYILMLEQAFFSPRPLPWSQQPVWQALSHFEPTPPEEPATFRRAKPLRRRASA
jgi:hypothetical protein